MFYVNILALSFLKLIVLRTITRTLTGYRIDPYLSIIDGSKML